MSPVYRSLSLDPLLIFTVPVTLVVLGAFFYTPPSPEQKKASQSFTSPDSAKSQGGFFERKFRALVDRPQNGGGGGGGAYPGENKTVFVAVISRMILVPLLMMPLLALMAKYDFFEAAADPVFVLSAVLLVSSVSGPCICAQVCRELEADAMP